MLLTLLTLLRARCFLRSPLFHSIEIATCKCRYHGYSGYFAVTMVRLSVRTGLILFCRVQVCASCASCAKGSGSRWCLHGFTAFARDHTSEPIHVHRVWTLQRFADCRPYRCILPPTLPSYSIEGNLHLSNKRKMSSILSELHRRLSLELP